MSDELTQADVQACYRQLQNDYQNLRREIREALLAEDREQYAELAGQVNDLEELAVADVLVDLNLAGIDRHVKHLASVENALYRIRHGHYGDCLDCKQAIEPERLRAAPEVSRCLQCQNHYERLYEGQSYPRA